MGICSTVGRDQAAVAPIRIGPHALRVPVLLAPMSGVTDLPFRRLAYRPSKIHCP